MRPVVLIIRDGWGVNEYHEGNSVVAAKTPVIDQIRARYPHCLLNCCGEAVGLPDGYQGSSEVGLCFPSRRGLIPRVSLVCKPEIPVAPRDEH